MDKEYYSEELTPFSSPSLFIDDKVMKGEKKRGRVAMERKNEKGGRQKEVRWR